MSSFQPSVLSFYPDESENLRLTIHREGEVAENCKKTALQPLACAWLGNSPQTFSDIVRAGDSYGAVSSRTEN